MKKKLTVKKYKFNTLLKTPEEMEMWVHGRKDADRVTVYINAKEEKDRYIEFYRYWSKPNKQKHRKNRYTFFGFIRIKEPIKKNNKPCFLPLMSFPIKYRKRFVEILTHLKNHKKVREPIEFIVDEWSEKEKTVFQFNIEWKYFGRFFGKKRLGVKYITVSSSGKEIMRFYAFEIDKLIVKMGKFPPTNYMNPMIRMRKECQI
jgi:hypothetical protein